MIDYKKAEQAKKLLEESGVDYTLAYVDENNVVIGNVQGSALKPKVRKDVKPLSDNGYIHYLRLFAKKWVRER